MASMNRQETEGVRLFPELMVPSTTVKKATHTVTIINLRTNDEILVLCLSSGD